MVDGWGYPVVALACVTQAVGLVQHVVVGVQPQQRHVAQDFEPQREGLEHEGVLRRVVVAA